MIKLYELRELVKLVNQSSLDEIEWKNDGVSISIKKEDPMMLEESYTEDFPEDIEGGMKQAATALEESATATLDMEQNSANPESSAVLKVQKEMEDNNLQTIRSPYIGIFSNSPKQGAEAYVKVGDKVTADTIVCNCIVEALKLSHDIQSGFNGEIVKVLVDNGEVIEYGQPLFLVNAKGE